MLMQAIYISIILNNWRMGGDYLKPHKFSVIFGHNSHVSFFSVHHVRVAVQKITTTKLKQLNVHTMQGLVVVWI